MLADAGAVGCGRLVETDGVGAGFVLAVADCRPQLHADLGGHRDKPSRKVGHLRVGQRLAESGGVLHLLDHSRVVVDTPLLDLVECAVIEQVFDADLILVLLNEVTESTAASKPTKPVARLRSRSRSASSANRDRGSTVFANRTQDDATGRPCWARSRGAQGAAGCR